MKRRFERTQGLREVPRRETLIGRPSLGALFGSTEDGDGGPRNRAMARAYLDHGYRMNQIADYFGGHYATVNRPVKALEDEMSQWET